MSQTERLQALFSRAAWRTEVEVRRRELEHRLEVALAEHAAAGRPVDQTRTSHEHAVRQALRDAQLAVDSKASPLAWINGSSVTMAWESVHEAGGELVELESDDAVRASLPRLVDWIQEVMDRDSGLRQRYETELNAMIAGTGAVDRMLIAQAHQDALNANNEKHANLRTFRNLLHLATAILAFLLLTLAIWHAANEHFVSLCNPSPPKGTQPCFSGQAPASRDIAVIVLIGAIGGILSVAFALGSEKAPPSRYNVRVAQMLLKPAAGGATAVIGVLLVQSGVLVSPAQSGSEALFLAYAAIFGFSQQLLTQFVDKRAGKLLGVESTSAT